MKIIKNVLTKETLDKTRLHLQKNIGAYKWSSSEILWNPGLRIGTTGSTLVQAYSYTETIKSIVEGN